ncbi:MAG: cyclic nucleotide-binding domain-containing protein [Planctomycetota bacterium]
MSTAAQKVHQQRRHFKKGEVIFREGDAGENFYLLEKGSLDVLITGKKIGIVNADQGPEFVGEVAALLGTPRTATVVAADACSAIEIPRVDIDNVLANAPTLGAKLAKSLCRKLAESATTHAERQQQGKLLLKSGSTEVTLKNYMKGIFALMEKSAEDTTGETAKQAAVYFRATNPWGIVKGDGTQIMDIA